ncbi:hypothetical protein LTR62_001041 [Meristemomyces frigidus]|uniref:Alpha-1,2-mannosyltransferase n=1 Tax=Meristemomyces frigidus TaxID=1508187 RepID=A0AAN7TC57_9PEZI|nr:hypothetical protein LTR62_001041 [Meristemomyces frigidus]
MKAGEDAEPFLGRWQAAGFVQHSTAFASHRLDQAKDVYLRWRQSKYALTRKQLLLGLGTVFFALVLLVAANRSSSTSGLVASSAANGVCSNARQNPHNIKAPLRPDVQRLTAFWPGVKHALDVGGRDIPKLDKPDYTYSPQGPTIWEFRARTDQLTPEQALKTRELHADFVRAIPPYPKKTFKGKGIVMLAGGRYSEYAVTALGVLREIGSTLPVEVWRRDQREEKHDWCREIEKEGMACRRLSDYMDTDLVDVKGGYEMKVLCLLFSSFEEIVFIDADNMALQRPELLFDTKAYKETGVILWHDYWKYDNIDWLDYIISNSPTRNENLWNETTHESGEIVWDKRRNWDALMLATYYNYYGPTLYYTLLNFNYAGWGDKDTFALAFRALQKPYHTVIAPPADAWERDKAGTRRIGMLQMMPGSQPPSATFFHVTTVKWSFREFVCEGCLPIWHTDQLGDAFVSYWEDPTSDLWEFLHNNLTLIEPGIDKWMPALPGTDDVPLDPEVVMWRAMEYGACRSKAWRHARTCMVARRYLVGTFGFSFVRASKPGVGVMEGNGEAWVPGMGEESCLIDPPIGRRRVVVR